MQLARTVPFQHNGTDYDIGIFDNGSEIVVRALKGRQPANGYRYCVDRTTWMDTRRMANADLLEHLVAIAMDDVREGRWESYVAMLESERHQE